MVSRIENLICLSGIGLFYSFTFYKFFTTKKKFDIVFHQEIKNNANKLINELNHPCLRFVETHDRKLVFLVGLENKSDDLEKIILINQILENFTPNYILHEKDVKVSTRQFYNCKNRLMNLFSLEENQNERNESNNDNKENNEDMNIYLQEASFVNEAIPFLITKLEEELFLNLQKSEENIDKIDNIEETINSLDIFKKLKVLEDEKDFYINLMSLITNYKAKKMLKNCNPIYVGVDFSVIKTILKKRLILNDEDTKDSLANISKSNIKERLMIKKEIFETNCKYDIYNDLINIMSQEIFEINSKSLKKIEPSLDKLYHDLVMDEFNEMIINNISDNKSLYIGLFLVNNKRLNSLYEAILDQNRITDNTNLI